MSAKKPKLIDADLPEVVELLAQQIGYSPWPTTPEDVRERRRAHARRLLLKAVKITRSGVSG